MFEELRIASKGGIADYSGITYERIERELRRVLAVSERGARGRPDARAAGHAAAVRARVMEPGREGRRAVLFPGRQGPPERDAVRGTGRGRG